MKPRGFTLIELLVVLTIIVGVIVATIPFSAHFTRKNQLAVRKNQIINAIKYARNQAIILDHSVVLSKLPGNDDWSKGMILFVDEHLDHQYRAGDKIIHQWTWDPAGLVVKWEGFRSDQYLLFHSDPSQSIASGSFTLRRDGNRVSKVILNRFGRAREA